MHGPVGALLNGYIANGQILHIGKRKYVWTWVESLILQWLQLVAVAQLSTHKGDTITMNGALTTDADVLSMLSPKPQHTLATVLSKSTQLINTLIGVSLQGGSSFQIKLNIALKLNRTSHEGMITR